VYFVGTLVISRLVCIVTSGVHDECNIWSSGWTVGVQLAGHLPLVWPRFSTGKLTYSIV